MPGEGRGAVVISKKVEASSAKRNALRRRLYAILRPLLKAGHASVIVYPNKKALAVSFTELKASLEAAL
jgi:ribonuclease P protein component